MTQNTSFFRRYILLGLVGLIGLSGCKPENADTTDGGSDDEVVRGIRYDYMDTTVSPRENFFLFTNGGYLKSKEIPAEESRWGKFNELRDESEARVNAILQDASAKEGADPASLEYKIGTYYRNGMDSAAVQEAGMEPLKPFLEEINAIANLDELMTMLGKMHRRGAYAAFSFWVGQDSKNSEQYIVNLSQGGLGLPDRDYYLSEAEDRKEIREKYLAFVTKTFELMEEEDAEAKAETVLAFETALAKASLDRVSRRDPNKTYHKMTVAELEDIAGLPWQSYFKAVGLENLEELNVAIPDFVAALEDRTKDYSLEEWKTYMRLATVRNIAGALSRPFVENSFDFYGKALEGTEQMKPRWKRVTSSTNGALGMGIGELYVERHFSSRAREIALEMVENILAVMKDRVSDLEWMSPETRTQALNKLNTILPKIGYPDKFRDFSGMEIKDQAFVLNVYASREFNFQYRLDKLGKPVDKTEWGITPQTVNAYYNPSKNEIVFPAGILQAPFFDENVEMELNYGGFGAVIGHELIHAFDDQGSKYDAQGNLANWWTDEDRENFEGRAEMVIQQYGEYKVLDTLHLNGQLTLGENIADIDGLRISYYAWKRSLDGKEVADKDGYTAEQRFFINYGQIWSSIVRDEYLRLMVATDPHSPPQWRVNGSTSSLPEFYEAFGVEEGDPMFRPEEKRMSIW